MPTNTTPAKRGRSAPTRTISEADLAAIKRRVEIVPRVTFSGERLKQQRLQAGLTLETVALAIGVRYQRLQEWEAGKHEPTATSLLQLIYLYNSVPIKIEQTGKENLSKLK